MQQHRQEIDGLRAIAITAVLLFHFYPAVFTNGYLGVDMFFVISGYLITLGLERGMAAGDFKFFDFYIRRIKRILPAVLVLLLVTSFCASFFLLSPDFIKFSESLLTSLGFFSNVYFFLTGGYFGGNDELKPLLHMWSLSVEEQFYIIFPLALYLIINFIDRLAFRILFVIFISAISYALNSYMNSIGGENAAFFLLPTRVWQFSAGVIFALLPNRCGYADLKNNAFIAIGLSLIAWNFYKPMMNVPAATFMTAGTGLLLWINWPRSSWFARILSNNVVRWIGLISFSLYLWHWPIVSFLRYITVDELPLWMASCGLLASMCIGYLSWRYVEEPFRRKFSTKQVLTFVFLMYLLLIGFGAMVLKENGFPGRHPSAANTAASAIDSNFRCPKSNTFAYGGSKACWLNKDSEGSYSLALLGNSHALMYAPIIARELNSGHIGGIVIPLNGCLPTYDVNISESCILLAKKNYESVAADLAIREIVIGTTWEHNNIIDAHGQVVDNGAAAFYDSLKNLVNEFKKQGKIVYLIGPIETPKINFASVLSRKIAFGNAEAIKLNADRRNFDVKFKEVINTFELELDGAFIQPSNYLCDASACHFFENDKAYYADGTHLSADGVREVEPAFQAFAAAIKKNSENSSALQRP